MPCYLQKILIYLKRQFPLLLCKIIRIFHFHYKLYHLSGMLSTYIDDINYSNIFDSSLKTISPIKETKLIWSYFL
jgi:hypothetical protein